MVFATLVAYGILAVVEIYSKRSALGCAHPIFVTTWFIIALIPTAIRTTMRRFHSRKKPKEGTLQLRMEN